MSGNTNPMVISKLESIILRMKIFWVFDNMILAKKCVWTLKNANKFLKIYLNPKLNRQ